VTLTLLAYSFRDHKNFALQILLLLLSWPINLESLEFRLFNLETLTALAYSFRDYNIFALLI